MEKEKVNLNSMIESLIEKTKEVQTYIRKNKIHLNGLDLEYSKLYEVLYRMNAILEDIKE